MRLDRDAGAEFRRRLIDARLSAAETTELEQLVAHGVDRELALAMLIRARELHLWRSYP